MSNSLRRKYSKLADEAEGKTEPRPNRNHKRFNLNYWLDKGRKVDRSAQKHLADLGLNRLIDEQQFVFADNLRVVCFDGFEVSIQASAYHYCYPKETWNESKYYERFELGMPNKRCELLMPYCENADCPTKSVYPQVPREVVQAMIEAHGGIQMLDNTRPHFPDIVPGEKPDG